MTKLMSVYESTKPNPAERHLKAVWRAEIKSHENSIKAEKKVLERRQASTLPLLKAGGLSQTAVNKLIREDASLSRTALKDAEKLLAKPTVDFAALHKQDVELARAASDRITNYNPAWQGYIWNPSYGGWWGAWNGESEEVPNVSFNVGANRFDPRAQSWGEGWWDSDFSVVHGYLAFRFSPPSWGHLHIRAYPWLHGYYSLYSNDTWYKSEYARAELDTWVDVYQSYWRAREYRRRFTLSGDELHPARSDRIDRQVANYYYTNIGAGDTVTIRVGARLYCRAKANSGRSKLNFQAGAANFVYVPYVYWYLHK